MREGFRRIGIVLGVLGVIGWSFVAVMILSEMVTKREKDIKLLIQLKALDDEKDLLTAKEQIVIGQKMYCHFF